MITWFQMAAQCFMFRRLFAFSHHKKHEMHQLLLLLTVVFVWISSERSVDIPCPVTVDVYSECSWMMFIWSSTYCWHSALITFCPRVWQRGMTRRACIENRLWNLLVPCRIVIESHAPFLCLAWPVQVCQDAVQRRPVCVCVVSGPSWLLLSAEIKSCLR